MRIPQLPEGIIAFLCCGGDITSDDMPDLLLRATDAESPRPEGESAYLLITDLPHLATLLLQGIIARDSWCPDTLFLSLACDPQDHEFAEWVQVVYIVGGKEETRVPPPCPRAAPDGAVVRT